MKIKLFICSLLLSGLSRMLHGQALVLENNQATLEIQTHGSAISHFAFKKNALNPFSWALMAEDMPANNKVGPPFRGHFLCTGRWGAPSDWEVKAGMPHNGEVNTQHWKVVQFPTQSAVGVECSTSCHQPLDMVRVDRKIVLAKEGASFLMMEKFTNLSAFDRIYNITQHPTIGAPFLAPSTLIDCNASLGFDQRIEHSNLEKASFSFPNGLLVDGFADLRQVNDDRGYVTSHIFPDTTKIGWVTATNPDQRLLIGYIFNTAEYPWLNLWHWKKDRKPYAHGLEFGTTGLGAPFPKLVNECLTFFGRKSFDWLFAGQTIEKKYHCFLAQLPENFKGVQRIELKGNKAVILENTAEKPRQVSVNLVSGW